jgi:hypothetical protein
MGPWALFWGPPGLSSTFRVGSDAAGRAGRPRDYTWCGTSSGPAAARTPGRGRFAVQTRDPELHELITEATAFNAHSSAVAVSVSFSLSSAAVGSIANDVMRHSMSV